MHRPALTEEGAPEKPRAQGVAPMRITMLGNTFYTPGHFGYRENKNINF